MLRFVSRATATDTEKWQQTEERRRQLERSNDKRQRRATISVDHRPTGPLLCTGDPGDHTHTSTGERNHLQRVRAAVRTETDSGQTCVSSTYRTVPDPWIPARPRRPAALPFSLEASDSTSSSPSFLPETQRVKWQRYKIQNVKFHVIVVLLPEQFTFCIITFS